MQRFVRRIQEATKSDAATARLVLGLILTEHNGIVSDLTPADFDRSALLCLAEVEMDAATSARVAETWGLPAELGQEEAAPCGA